MNTPNDEVPSRTPLNVKKEAVKKAATAATHVTLKVSMQHKVDVFFRIKRNLPLSKVMNDYCERLQLDPKVLRFIYDGIKIGKDQTADELEMEDDDVIDVMSEQLGGGGCATAPISSAIF